MHYPKLRFDFEGHPGTPGMCLNHFLMIFSDSWRRKKVVLPPAQIIFIFGPCGGPLRGPKGPEGKSQNPHMARIWLYIKCFDLGDGFKPCSDDFFGFSDPENGGSHLVWPGGLPYGLRGVSKGKSSKGPQKWPTYILRRQHDREWHPLWPFSIIS